MQTIINLNVNNNNNNNKLHLRWVRHPSSYLFRGAEGYIREGGGSLSKYDENKYVLKPDLNDSTDFALRTSEGSAFQMLRQKG